MSLILNEINKDLRNIKSFVKFLARLKWVRVGSWSDRVDYYAHKDFSTRISVPSEKVKNKERYFDNIIINLSECYNVPRIDIIKAMNNSKIYLKIPEGKLNEGDAPESKSEARNYLEGRGVINVESDSFDGKNIGRRIGVGTNFLNQHRLMIRDRVKEILDVLIDEAVNKKNVHVGMWLVDKIIPNPRPSTFTESDSIKELKTLSDVREQSSRVIQEVSMGQQSIEAAVAMINMYKDHKDLIEAEEIEPLAREVKKRLGK